MIDIKVVVEPGKRGANCHGASHKLTTKSKVIKMTDFTVVESLFSRFLQAVQGVFSPSEIAEVSDFVNVGEYGLALDTAVDIFVEEQKVATGNVIVLAEELAITMGVSAAEYSDRLRGMGKG